VFATLAPLVLGLTDTREVCEDRYEGALLQILTSLTHYY